MRRPPFDESFLYTGKPGRRSTGGIEDICKIDPAACPNLDTQKGKSRVFKETLYAVRQTAPAGEILLTGPLSGAPAVRRSGGASAGASVVARAPGAISVKPVAAARPELFDIEAKVRIEVADIARRLTPGEACRSWRVRFDRGGRWVLNSGMRRGVVCWFLAGVLAGCSDGEDAGSDPDQMSGGSASGGAAATGGGGTAATTSGGSAGTTSGGGSGGSAGGGGTGGGTGGSAGSSGSGGAPGECGEFTTFEDGASPSREIFLDATASGPGDGSPDDPYVDLESALSDLTPGTALRIRPGTYLGGAYASGIAGTEAAPIWIGGVPGMARPVLSGGSNAIQLSSASYLVVHDLEITGQDSNGLNIDDGSDYPDGAAHHLVFRGLFIHDIGSGGNQDCLKLSGVDDFFVFGSEFRGCSGGSAIDHVGCHRGVIAQNTFLELGGNGVQSKGGSEDIEITQNRFLDAGERAVNMGGSTGFEFFRPALSTGENFEARNIRVLANLFRGGTSPVAFVGCVDCLAANNTIVDPERWVVRILQETTSTAEYTFAPARDGRFSNNAVYFSSAALSTHVNVGADTDAASFEFSNNLWYAHDAPEESEPAYLPAAETDGIYGEDPGFADVANDDVSIDATSPLAGAGRALTEVTGDLDGACFAEPPAIGALEVE